MSFKFESNTLNSGVTPDLFRNKYRISIRLSTSLSTTSLSKRESIPYRFLLTISFMRDFMSKFSLSKATL